MRIALVQMFCEWGKVEGNLRRAEEQVREARRRGAELVAFPEMSVHGMWKDHLVRLAAEPLDGPIVKRMAACARKHRTAIGFGMAEKSSGKPFNAYVLVDGRGELAGVYRKNYVTRLEEDYLRRDRRRSLFDLCGRRVAVAICADNCHPELLASYARRGADLILMPHAWDADPVLKDGKTAAWRDMDDMVTHYVDGRVERYRTHDEMLAAFTGRLGPLCRQLGVPGAFVNQVGAPHPLIPFVGPSFVLDRTGKVLARSRSKKEGMLTVDIP